MTQSRKDEVIKTLDLKKMNLESGLYNVVGVSNIEHGGQSANNVIYFMLTREMPISFLHHMQSDDVQILIEGGPADYFMFGDNGSCKKQTMGRDIAGGQNPIISVPGGTSKALVLHEDAEYLLIGSVVSPAWSPTNTRYGANATFLDRFEGASDWATRPFLQSLVGANFDAIQGGIEKAGHFYLNEDDEIIGQGMQLTDGQWVQECKKLMGLGILPEIFCDIETERFQALQKILRQTLASD
ncbi:MAG: putative cupin superfamily sugar epimerase [Candidatus Azotimanducaceae bacterium]|jgi:predicted cupin superfamily sugar epimerase